MRLSDFAMIVAAVGAFFMAMEDRSVITVAAPEQARAERPPLITCPLQKPDFATVMQAAFLGDGTLLVEQQTQTKVRHIKDC